MTPRPSVVFQMNDDEELAGFRADSEMSQYGNSTDSQQPRMADEEVQKRWGEWVDLFLQKQRRVQGGQIIQETWR